MENQTLLLFLLLMLSYRTTKASQCTTRQSESNVFLYGFLIESFKVDHLSACTSKCKKNKICASINMNLMKMKCDLNYSTRKRYPRNMASQPSMVYMEIRDAAPGSRPDIPITSCKKLKESDRHGQVKSGVYWMKFNEPSSTPFKVFCDMTTDGGGWTLVYSYTFTQYNSFTSDSNAVTPIPNWPVDRSVGIWVSESTTIPLRESSRSAMDFALWKKIGNEFLINTNINNKVACVEGTGSLVNWRTGSVTCRVVKVITPTCTNVAPNRLNPSTECGPALYLDTKYMFHFDGKTDGCAPAHDPCGLGKGDSFSHLSNETNPGGAIYIR